MLLPRVVAMIDSQHQFLAAVHDAFHGFIDVLTNIIDDVRIFMSLN